MDNIQGAATESLILPHITHGRQNSTLTQCSPQHTQGMVAPYPFTTGLTLMCGANGFDAVTSSTQNM